MKTGHRVIWLIVAIGVAAWLMIVYYGTKVDGTTQVTKQFAAPAPIEQTFTPAPNNDGLIRTYGDDGMQFRLYSFDDCWWVFCYRTSNSSACGFQHHPRCPKCYPPRTFLPEEPIQPLPPEIPPDAYFLQEDQHDSRTSPGVAPKRRES